MDFQQAGKGTSLRAVLLFTKYGEILSIFGTDMDQGDVFLIQSKLAIGGN